MKFNVTPSINIPSLPLIFAFACLITLANRTVHGVGGGGQLEEGEIPALSDELTGNLMIIEGLEFLELSEPPFPLFGGDSETF